MSDSTLPAVLLTISWQCRTSDITPTAAFEFENALNGLLREIGRLIVDSVYNHLQPNEPNLLPIKLDYAGEHYRRRKALTRGRSGGGE